MKNAQDESIQKICRALGSSHPLSRQVLSVLADPEVPLTDIQPALCALTGRSRFGKRERLLACWLIAHAHWSEDHRGQLSAALSLVVESAITARKPGRVALRWFGRSMLANLLFFVVCMTFTPGVGMSYGLFYLFSSLLVFAALLTVVGAVISIPLSVWLDHCKLRQFVPIVDALGEVGQPESTASLAKALVHKSLSEAASSALARVTARLRSEDYGTLPLETVPALCGAVYEVSSQTVLVILQALRMIGDGRAVRTVTYLSKFGLYAEIREAATDLLPILQQRERDSQAVSMLLRASQAPAEGKQTLLRAVWEEPRVDSSQLLRATLADGSGGESPHGH